MRDPQAIHLRLLTLNCFGVPFLRQTRARLRTLARELNDSQVSVLLLQEVQFTPFVPLLRESFHSFPYCAFEPYLYAPKGGLLTLSRFPIQRTQFVLFEKRGRLHSPAIADWMLHKGILATELNVSGTPVTTFNTHLVANYSADWSRGNHYARHQHAELKQLSAMVNALDGQQLAIVAGDFNLPRGSWLYREFIRETGARDPLADSDEPTFRPRALLPARYVLALDHIFVRAPRHAQLQIAGQIVFKDKLHLTNGRLGYLSDHYGVELDATMQLGSRAATIPARERRLQTMQDQ